MNNAYLIIHNNVVCGTRAVEMDITEEKYKSLSEKEQQYYMEEAAWEYADVYPEEIDGRVSIVVSLGLVGCDTHVDTDVDNLEDWDALDVAEQNSMIRQAFWEAVECHVVFEPNDAEAEKHTNWGYRG
ncbi:hypothetical protein DS691_21430 [Salmonella enterica subsp. enterica serovar Bareilly]|nr:hypothetical protein [Salmonella enterica subsp. enterica serovar Bareilly]